MTYAAGRAGAPLFPDPLAAFATTLVWADPDAAGLDGPETRDDLRNRLKLFHASVGGSWPAVCSLWAQIYFNALVIPAICMLHSREKHVDGTIAIIGQFCPTTGVPLGFRMSSASPISSRLPGDVRFIHVVERHICRLIDELHGVARLSKPMLWESAQRTSAWTLCQIALEDPSRSSTATASILHTGLMAAQSPQRQEIGRPAPRRFCCLRYQLPGFDQCSGICPRAQCRDAGARRRSSRPPPVPATRS